MYETTAWVGPHRWIGPCTRRACHQAMAWLEILCHSWRHSDWSMHNSLWCDCMHDSSILGDWFLLAFCLEFLYMFFNYYEWNHLKTYDISFHDHAYNRATVKCVLLAVALWALTSRLREHVHQFARAAGHALHNLRLHMTTPKYVQYAWARHPAQCGEYYPANLTDLNRKFA